MRIDHLAVPSGAGFKLASRKTADSRGIPDREAGEAALEKCRERLVELQEKLYAQDQWAVLLIFQALDAAGKDGTIKWVMSGVNPQGCQVFSFKAPSPEELDHDFLWRHVKCLPERGRIGIHNRSYYEEVLVVRVHPELLEREKLPAPCREDVFKRRFDDINCFEKYLVNNGVVPIKFFLHVSRKEQLDRLLKRLDRPDKNWKFDEGDVRERSHFDEYQAAYEEMLRHTSTRHAPWYVVPADQKWYTRLAVASVVVSRLEELGLAFPEVPRDRKRDLGRIRRDLAAIR